MGQELLEEDHEAVGKLLDELRAELRSDTDAKTAYGLLDRLWARLAVHIRAEHLCLFPAILTVQRRACEEQGGLPPPAEVESAVERLRADHDFFMRELAAAVNTLRGVLSGRGSDDVKAELDGVSRAVDAVAARLEKHNAVEEEGVYRWALEQLLPNEEAQLTVDIRRELTNHPPRFNGDSRPA